MKHWKHTVAILLTLCLIGGGTALAQDEWQLCSPEEVDVSGVQEINGRLVGEIALPESAGHIRLMVDCPVPEPFTAQQQAVPTGTPSSSKTRESWGRERSMGSQASSLSRSR